MTDPAGAGFHADSSAQTKVLQWGLLKVILTLILLTGGYGVNSILFPAFLDRLAFPISSIGVLVSLLNVAALLSRLPTGLVYRASYAPRLIRVTLVLFGISNALYPFAAAPVFLWPLRFCNGLLFGVATTVNFAIYMDAIPPGVPRHRALALYAAGLAAGNLVGNLLGGYAADFFGMTNAFLIAGCLPVVAVLFALRPSLYPQPREDAPPVPGAAGAGRGPGGAPFVRESRLRRALSLFLDPLVLDMFMVAFFLNLFFGVLRTYITLYALAVGLALGSVGLIKGALSLTNAVIRPFSGDLANRFGDRVIANFGLTATAALIMVIPFFSSVPPLAILFVFLGVVRAAVLVSNTVKASRVGEKRGSRGMASGLYNAATDLGSIAGPVYGGLVASRVGLRPMFWVCPVLALGAYFLVRCLARLRRFGPAA